MGVPNPMNLDVDADIDLDVDADVKADVKADAKIQLADLHLNLDSLPKELPKLRIGLDKLEVKLDPLDLHVSLSLEVPRMRTHLPAHFQVGLTVGGFELVCLKLCGEAQMIMEPYSPSPAERCAHGALRQTPIAVTPVNPVVTPAGTSFSKAEVRG